MNYEQLRARIGSIRESNVRRTDIPDTHEGLDAVLDKVLQGIHRASGDPVIVRTTRVIQSACLMEGPMSDEERGDCTIAGIWNWLRSNVRFTNDPTGKEFIASPERLVRDLKTPRPILQAILGPVITDAVIGRRDIQISDHKVFHLNSVYAKPCNIRAIAMGDCEELAGLSGAMLKSVGIPVKIVLGGNRLPNGRCGYHHIWIQAGDSRGRWIDMDLARPEFKLGDYWKGFECVVVSDPL